MLTSNDRANSLRIFGTEAESGTCDFSAEFQRGVRKMLTGRSVLIAEDEPITAMDLAAAVSHEHGHVIGPVSTLAEGMKLVAAGLVHGAILDVQLVDGDVTPLAHVLLDGGAAVVFHSASPIPAEITARHGPVRYCMKPTVSDVVVAHLVKGFAARN
jgi:DNA-binding NarL/FixJ family response regulator